MNGTEFRPIYIANLINMIFEEFHLQKTYIKYYTHPSKLVVCGLTTARHIILAMAASTALPFFFKTSNPIKEQSVLSVATLPCGII